MKNNLTQNIDIIFKKNENIILNITLISSIIYFIIRSVDCLFLISFPIGDERVFLEEFKYLLENGFIKTIKKGTSFFFISLSFLLNVSSGIGAFSLRLVSFIATLSLIIYFLLRIKFKSLKSKKFFFATLLFLIPTTGASIHATNDSLFFLSLIIFLFELIIFKAEKNILLISSAVFMIVTRPVAIVYLGILIISSTLYTILCSNKNIFHILKKLFQSVLIGFSVYILISFPNFFDGNFELTNSNKSIFENRGITWTEWVYHSQLVGNNSSRFGFFTSMVGWDEALKYKLINGDKSLPNSFLEYLVFDFGYVLRRTMSSIVEIGIISLRYLGFLFLLFPIYMIKKIRNNRYNNLTEFGFYALTGILTWAIIWPGLVQHRWLFPFYTIIIYCFSAKYKRENSFTTYLSYELNLVLINVIIIWFFWKENFFSGLN